MQSKFRLPLFLLMGALIIFSSCSKTNEQGKYIPKNAALVLLLNGESISSKLPWSEIKQNELFKQFYVDSALDSHIKSALDNPENTGIDIKKDFLFFIQKDSMGGYVAVEGVVKDAVKFKQFYSELLKGATEKEKDGIHSLGTDRVTASWKDEKFIIVIDAPQLNNVDKFSNSYDRNEKSKEFQKRDGSAISIMLFDLKANGSMARNEKFTELVKEKGDIHFWLNMGEFRSDFNSPGMKALSMVNFEKLYDGSIATLTADFENGQINLDMKSYCSKELTEVFRKYRGSKVNTDMIKRYSAKEVGALLAFNFKPEGIREFIKVIGLEGIVNMGSGLLGFSLDDFVKANKGDLLIAVSDFNTNSFGNTKPANALFAASVGDKSSFGKLIDAGNRMGKYGRSDDVFYNTSDEYFAIGNNKDVINKFTGSGANSSFDFIDKISGSPIAGYANFQYLIKSMRKDVARDSLDGIIFDASIKMWDKLFIKGGDFEDGGFEQHAEITLIDKSTNSLKSLNTYLGLIGSIEQQKKIKKEKGYASFDSTYEPMSLSPVEVPADNK